MEGRAVVQRDGSAFRMQGGRMAKVDVMMVRTGKRKMVTKRHAKILVRINRAVLSEPPAAAAPMVVPQKRTYTRRDMTAQPAAQSFSASPFVVTKSSDGETA